MCMPRININTQTRISMQIKYTYTCIQLEYLPTTKYKHVHVRIYVYECMFCLTCVAWQLHETYLCRCLYACIYIHVDVWMPVYIYILYTCRCLYAYADVSMHICIYVDVCMPKYVPKVQMNTKYTRIPWYAGKWKPMTVNGRLQYTARAPLVDIIMLPSDIALIEGMCLCVCIFVCVCVYCVCTHSTYTYTHIYI